MAVSRALGGGFHIYCLYNDTSRAIYSVSKGGNIEGKCSLEMHPQSHPASTPIDLQTVPQAYNNIQVPIHFSHRPRTSLLHPQQAKDQKHNRRYLLQKTPLRINIKKLVKISSYAPEAKEFGPVDCLRLLSNFGTFFIPIDPPEKTIWPTPQPSGLFILIVT